MLLSKSAYMVILYSSFLVEVQNGYQSGYAKLKAAKQLDVSFLERFALYSREQQHSRKMSSEGEMGSYLEFQKNYRWDGSLGTRAVHW